MELWAYGSRVLWSYELWCYRHIYVHCVTDYMCVSTCKLHCSTLQAAELAGATPLAKVYIAPEFGSTKPQSTLGVQSSSSCPGARPNRVRHIPKVISEMMTR